MREDSPAPTRPSAGMLTAGRRSTLVPFKALRESLPMLRLSLRGDLQQLAAAFKASGMPLSVTPCRAVATGGVAALWLGPDEQLLLAPEFVGAKVTRMVTEPLENVLHSLVDISQRQLGFDVVGSHAPTLLNSGCPLNLSGEAFPVGACTRTLFEKSEIVLWRSAAEIFHVEAGRSFAPYVTGLLAQAEKELGE